MKPFKIRVDWTCQDAYSDDPVEVELHIMDEDPMNLRYFDDKLEAVRWARKWLEDRGFDWTCDINTHQRRNDKHITLHAQPRT